MLGLDRRDGGVEVYTTLTSFSAHLHGCFYVCRHSWRFPLWPKQTECFQACQDHLRGASAADVAIFVDEFNVMMTWYSHSIKSIPSFAVSTISPNLWSAVSWLQGYGRVSVSEL